MDEISLKGACQSSHFAFWALHNGITDVDVDQGIEKACR